MRLLYILTILSFSTAFADQGLDQLKQSFSGILQTAGKEFDKAAKMKPLVLKKGTELSKEDCEAAKAKIRANYKIDPFEVIYEEGSIFRYMFGGQYGLSKNFIQNITGNSNLSIPYSFVIQLEGRDFWREIISNYFMDSNYRIVEIQELSFYPKTDELLEYDITSIDPSGNVYFSSFTKNYIMNSNLEGTQTIEKFIAADGSYPYPLVRNTVKHKTNSAKDYQVLVMKRSDKKDWDEFLLPITHAWSGGFYNYSGKQYGTNRYSSSLTIKYLGTKEYCAYGTIKEDKRSIQFPADNTNYYNCINY